MTETPSETPDLSPGSLAFQILVAGTLIFLVALFWLTEVPRSDSGEVRVATAASRIVIGIRILGCYLAFVGVVLGHKVLGRAARGGSEEQE